MYAEFLVASAAALVWARTDNPLISQFCHNLITMASLTTLLFNGNFLMRFDGYYIISDVLEIQNLYTSGQRYVRYLVRRYLLGLADSSPIEQARNRWLVQCYGLASLWWRISFCLGILLTAATLFHGAGIILSCLVAVAWIGAPSVRFLQYLWMGQENEQPQRWRFFGIVGGATAALAFLLGLPWPGQVVAIGVVDYEPLEIVRAASPGFLRTMHVRSGQIVRAGQPLAILENTAAESELADLQIAIEQSEVRSRMLQGNQDYAHAQVEEKNRESMRRQHIELEEKVAGLSLRAPINGRVVGRELETLTGQFLESGATVLALGREDQKSIRVSISQQDADFFLRQVGKPPRVRIRGRLRQVRGAQLTKVDPRASRNLPYAALAAPCGGPLAVVPRSDSEGVTESAYELVEPHFQATVTLPEEEAVELRAGQLARIGLAAADESIGAHLATILRRWMRRRLMDEQL
jgi:putative peptide zinc metalloprotease protein